ncbi:MAG: hypothetical protein ACKVOJ_13240 [Sphingomonadaceae bacterium]
MKLICVYNAEAGLLNALIDSVHKTLSPDTYPCDLCAITYGVFTMDKQWRRWIKALPMPTHFYHRADFKAAWPNVAVTLPVIMLEQKSGLTTIVAAHDFSGTKTVNDLIALLETRLAKYGDQERHDDHAL